MTKRSRSAALTILGAAAFTLAGCEEEKTDARAFPDRAACEAAAETGAAEGTAWFTAADCATAFATAEAEHLETAPRYESKELCEAEHGAAACAADPAVAPGSGMGASFLPLIAGYMLGSALGGGRGVSSQPLVRSAGGGFSTPDGSTKLSTNSGGGRIGAAAFNRAAPTIGKAPMSNADVARRGGFGTSCAGRTSTGTGG